MLDYQKDQKVIQNILDTIKNGKIFTLIYFKKNGELRIANARQKSNKAYFSPNVSPTDGRRGTKIIKNILLYWDNNSEPDKNGNKFRRVLLPNLLFFKMSNNLSYDFTYENDIRNRFNMSDEDIENIKKRYRIPEDAIVYGKEKEVNNYLYEIIKDEISKFLKT